MDEYFLKKVKFDMSGKRPRHVSSAHLTFRLLRLRKSHDHHLYALMASPNDLDLETLGTPEACVADFCLIPVFLQLQLQVFRS